MKKFNALFLVIVLIMFQKTYAEPVIAAPFSTTTSAWFTVIYFNCVHYNPSVTQQECINSIVSSVITGSTMIALALKQEAKVIYQDSLKYQTMEVRSPILGKHIELIKQMIPHVSEEESVRIIAQLSEKLQAI